MIRTLPFMMSSYWANFAADGDPNTKGLPVWPVVKEKTSERAMIPGDKVESGTPLDAPRVEFYDGAYAKLILR